MTRDDTDPELVGLALKLQKLERDDQEGEDNLFPESFMQEFTDYQTWDEFRIHLAATPRSEREAFVTRTTRFVSYEVMERTALERLRAGAFSMGGREV